MEYLSRPEIFRDVFGRRESIKGQMDEGVRTKRTGTLLMKAAGWSSPNAHTQTEGVHKHTHTLRLCTDIVTHYISLSSAAITTTSASI